ncbi:hypothetical protein BY996DRAFT_6417445 [Phakopsora pachyrhizi]|nr:hypothetical protein BY996DRAFT_6417445 [Phakopsora pachyrhizi]
MGGTSDLEQQLLQSRSQSGRRIGSQPGSADWAWATTAGSWSVGVHRPSKIFTKASVLVGRHTSRVLLSIPRPNKGHTLWMNSANRLMPSGWLIIGHRWRLHVVFQTV